MPDLIQLYPAPFTYQEYAKLPESVRLEIIDGVVYDMAPLDIVLDDSNVVEPDMFVVCDLDKITEKNIQGAPDLVIEVLSPSNSIKDRRNKKWLYERHGVREFIIISPLDETAERFWLEDGRYGLSDLFAWDESFPSNLFPELLFDLRVIFEKENVVAEPDPAWLVQARRTYPDMPR